MASDATTERVRPSSSAALGEGPVAPSPRLGSVLRTAATDFYFNSWRLVPANLAWGLSLVAVVVLTAMWPPAIVLLPFLAIPAAGIARMAALVARGQSLGFSDFGSGVTRSWREALVVGAAAALLAIVFTSNLVIGLGSGNPAGWLFGAFALYGDIGLAMMAVATWPILVDPMRDELPLARRLRLAALVILAWPGRMAGLTLLLAVLMIVSTIAFAAALMVSAAYSSLVAARYVLPLADRFEERASAGPRP
jgi:hypothetical protein